MNDATRRYVVTGHVQNVFFRDWTVERATALGLTGWVRNRADGSVGALAHGHPDSLAAFEERLRKGPAAARVDHLAIAPADEAPPAGFERRRDG